MVARSDNEERQLTSRRQTALAVLFPALLVLLLLGGGVGYIALSEQPVRVGPYTVFGPRCQAVVWYTIAPAPGNSMNLGPVSSSPRPLTQQQALTWVSLTRGNVVPIQGRRSWQLAGATVIGP